MVKTTRFAAAGLGVLVVGAAAALAIGARSTGAGNGPGAGDGVPPLAFHAPVVGATSASLDTGGGTVEVTVRRAERESVCIDVEGPPGSTSATSCGSTFAEAAALPAGFGRARVGDHDVVVVAGVADGRTDRVAILLPNGVSIEGVVETLPGRVERAFAAVVLLDADDGAGPAPVLRYRLFDAAGTLLHDAPA